MTLEALRVTCFVTVPPTVLYKSRKLCHKYHLALFLWIMTQSWTVVENLGCWEQHLPLNIRYTKELARVCSIQRLSVLCFAGRATPAEFKFMKKLHQKGSSITGFCRDEDEIEVHYFQSHTALQNASSWDTLSHRRFSASLHPSWYIPSVPLHSTSHFLPLMELLIFFCIYLLACIKYTNI